MKSKNKWTWVPALSAVVLVGTAVAQETGGFDVFAPGGGAPVPDADAGGGEIPGGNMFGGGDADTGAADASGPVNPEVRERDAALESEQERVRREYNRAMAKKKLDEANANLDAQQWSQAIEAYAAAIQRLEEVELNEEYRRQAELGKARANYQLAKIQYDLAPQENEAALELATLLLGQSTIAYNRVGGEDMKMGLEKNKELQDEIDLYSQKLKDGRIKRRIEEEDKYVSRKDAVDKLLARGRDEHRAGDFLAAERTFQEVLVYDSFQQEAIEKLIRIREEMNEIRRRERRASVNKQILMGTEAWLIPERYKEITRKPQAAQEDPDKADEVVMLSRMERIPISNLDFDNVTIVDALDYLHAVSKEADPEQIGINFIYRAATPGAGGPAAPAPAPGAFGDPWGAAAPAAPAAPAGVPADMPVIPQLKLNNVNMLEALKWICDLTGLYYRVEGQVIVVDSEDTDELVTRFYPVDSTRFITLRDIQRRTIAPTPGGGGNDPFATGGGGDIFGPGGGAAAGGGADDLRQMFEPLGVKFGRNGRVIFEQNLSQLIVSLPPHAIPQFEKVLKEINVAPAQVEIEARFVEVLQSDLQELGFEWILNDDAEIAVAPGPAPVASKERIIANKDENGFTKGLRFFGQDVTAKAISASSRSTSSNFMGDILQLSGVLTNPELSLVIHALDNKGNSDILSAPRVTTVSGVNAVIEVVREIIYPTEFDVTENDINFNGGGGGGGGIGGGNQVFIPPTVIPGGFETRQTGVILNVTPQVNPDNYTINLVLVPEIAELVDWIQYGTQVPVGDGSFYNINMPQPIFASRNISTQMMVWDGHTVVMGGLIREVVTEFEDKVPLLGDIPLLGRLFRSEGSYSEQRNLLIFVTARLVDPRGKPVNTGTVGLQEGSRDIEENSGAPISIAR